MKTMILPLSRNVLLLSSLFALGACATSAPVATGTTAAPDTAKSRPAAASQAAAPLEDLSSFRPTFAAATTARPTAPKTYVAPTNQVNTQIEQRLRDQAYTNQNVKYAQGFRILAYVGLEREQAMGIRRTIISRYPAETDYLTFKQPLFRLYVGDYLTRLEAEQAMQRIRPLAPKAELAPAQVLLNKTTF